MLELRNRTPLAAALVPGLDRDARDFVTVVIKGSFALTAGRAEDEPLPLPLLEEPLPLVWADEFHGEPDSSSIARESEVGPAKSGTDVVLLGQAHAPPGGARQVDVTLEAGPLSKTVRVFGDRQWTRTLGFSSRSKPEEFERMPLIYERAFGGADVSHGKESKHSQEERNPVGVGYTSAGRGEHFDGLRLPNLEDPQQLIGRPKDKPTPAGFGFIGRSWEPRKSFSGTYDDAWLESRAPLLPQDFDARYFRSAHPDLCSEAPFLGGEAVRVRNASQAGELRFRVPGLRFEVRAEIRGEVQLLETSIDTLLIEPDEQRLSLTWKATLPCPRALLLVSYIRIRELERFA